MTGAVTDLGLGAELANAAKQSADALKKKRVRNGGVSAAVDELGLG